MRDPIYYIPARHPLDVLSCWPGCGTSRGMGSNRRYWTVVKTKEASSATAVRHVASQDFPICHLMFRERRVLGVRRVRPLFPHYLLVSVSLRDDTWKRLHSTRGVANIFTSGGVPSQIPDHHVDHFRRLENSLGYIELEEHEAPRFQPNQIVQSRSGLFEDKFGVYQGLAGTRSDRVRVLFEILGRPTEFEVDAHSLA